MPTTETKKVRVATLLPSCAKYGLQPGKRYLLNSFHLGRVLLWGEVQSFKGLRSVHTESTWIPANVISWVEQEKTPALLLALLKQAASEEQAVQVDTYGAKLVALNARPERARAVPERPRQAALIDDATKALMVRMYAWRTG